MYNLNTYLFLAQATNCFVDYFIGFPCFVNGSTIFGFCFLLQVKLRVKEAELSDVQDEVAKLKQKHLDSSKVCIVF